jgi:deoxyribodipyrimidine photo-lyase
VLRVGVIHLPFHRRFPWSASRWEFVMTRLAAITDRVFIGDLADLPRVIRATQITTEHTLNPGYREALDTIATTPPTPPARLINWPAQTCLSYSKFWQQAHPGLKMFRR